MADTIVTNSPGTNDSGAGWVVALIIFVAVAVGGTILYQKGFFNNNAPKPADTTNINIEVPTPTPTPDTTQ